MSKVLGWLAVGVGIALVAAVLASVVRELAWCARQGDVEADTEPKNEADRRLVG